MFNTVPRREAISNSLCKAAIPVNQTGNSYEPIPIFEVQHSKVKGEIIYLPGSRFLHQGHSWKDRQRKLIEW